MKTAVEQLIDNLETLLNYKVKGEIEEDKPVFEMFQQALELEKQQIIDAKDCWFEDERDGEQYYSETYKPYKNYYNMAIYHLTTNIAGLLKNCKTDKKLGLLFGMDGKEARKELKELLAKGHKLLPSENCKHFDPFEHGCQCRFHQDENKTEN
jgi:ElaB/YqjD/DUF883 family membrane-anchored ribosome-binding protein